jgi:hypothetical protein
MEPMAHKFVLPFLESLENREALLLMHCVVLLSVGEFFDMKPAGLHWSHAGPWPYMAPTPVLDASHMTQTDSVDESNESLDVVVIPWRSPVSDSL